MNAMHSTVYQSYTGPNSLYFAACIVQDAGYQNWSRISVAETLAATYVDPRSIASARCIDQGTTGRTRLQASRQALPRNGRQEPQQRIELRVGRIADACLRSGAPLR